jgi:hypothetical protein
MDINELKKKIDDEFGPRMGFLGAEILTLAMTGQPCDVTFYESKPSIGVTIDQDVYNSLVGEGGEGKLREVLENIGLSNDRIVNIAEIWTVNPMPKDGPSEEAMAAVDMALADQQVGPNGETLRKMISETYHCDTPEEEDRYIRRFIAS